MAMVLIYPLFSKVQNCFKQTWSETMYHNYIVYPILRIILSQSVLKLHGQAVYTFAFSKHKKIFISIFNKYKYNSYLWVWLSC